MLSYHMVIFLDYRIAFFLIFFYPFYIPTTFTLSHFNSAPSLISAYPPTIHS